MGGILWKWKNAVACIEQRPIMTAVGDLLLETALAAAHVVGIGMSAARAPCLSNIMEKAKWRGKMACYLRGTSA